MDESMKYKLDDAAPDLAQKAGIDGRNPAITTWDV